LIRPATKRYRVTGASLKQILTEALGLHPYLGSRGSRIVVPADLDGQRFDVTASVSPNKMESLKALILNALENALGIKVKRITREMDAYVLTAPKGLTGSLQPTKATTFHASSDKGVIAASAADLRDLEVAIEMAIKIPAVDETGLQGKFDWNLLYDGDNPKSILEAIRKEFGLETTLARRPIEFFIVEKIGQ
jgi:uncharacterized protein (TIGR03435 family)